MADKKAKKEEPEEEAAEQEREQSEEEVEKKREAEAGKIAALMPDLPVPDEQARVLGMRGEKLLGFISPAQRGEVKQIIAAEIAKEAADERAAKNEARLQRMGQRDRRARRLAAGQEARAVEGHGPLEYPYAPTGYGGGSGNPSGGGGGCSSCGGK